MPTFQPLIVIAALVVLVPYLGAAFLPNQVRQIVERMPTGVQLLLPFLLSVPYVLVATATGRFHPAWFGLYACLPPSIALASRLSPDDQRVIWPRLLILAILGLAVDLRWFDRAWPPHLALFNKVILLDAGIYAFVLLRPSTGGGFDLRLRLPDIGTGLREFIFYLPIALGLGLALGFLHVHPVADRWAQLPLEFAVTWIFTFFFIAVPEELYFRGWLQNLLERRLGRRGALIVASVLFGLSHFNKRAALFNWRYVLLAAIAGIFYGRAWRRNRRIGASAVTHATVDSVWSLLLR